MESRTKVLEEIEKSWNFYKYLLRLLTVMSLCVGLLTTGTTQLAMTFNKQLILCHRLLQTVADSPQILLIQYLYVMDLHNFWVMEKSWKINLKKSGQPEVCTTI